MLQIRGLQQVYASSYDEIIQAEPRPTKFSGERRLTLVGHTYLRKVILCLYHNSDPIAHLQTLLETSKFPGLH